MTHFFDPCSETRFHILDFGLVGFFAKWNSVGQQNEIELDSIDRNNRINQMNINPIENNILSQFEIIVNQFEFIDQEMSDSLATL